MQIALTNHPFTRNPIYLNNPKEICTKDFQGKIFSNTKAVYYENEFGKIYDEVIYIESLAKEIKIKEVAFLKIRKDTDKTYNLIATVLIVFFISGVLYFQNNFVLMLLLLLATAFCMLFAMFHKKHNYYVQIILCRIEQITIKIDENQQIEVDAFTRKLAHYRQLNPDLKL